MDARQPANDACSRPGDQAAMLLPRPRCRRSPPCGRCCCPGLACRQFSEAPCGVRPHQPPGVAQGAVLEVRDGAIVAATIPISESVDQVIPDPATAAVLIQILAFDQLAEVLFERIATGAGQLHGLADRDSAVLPGKLDNLQ